MSKVPQHSRISLNRKHLKTGHFRPPPGLSWAQGVACSNHAAPTNGIIEMRAFGGSHFSWV